jgi:cytochrome c553
LSDDTSSSSRRACVSGVAYTLGVAIVAFAVGFWWLPRLQGGVAYRSWWQAICSAAGVVTRANSGAGSEERPGGDSSRVIVTQQMLESASAEAIGRGATLALQCTMCHGGRGISNADTPNLAGQYAPAIYKELRDYQSGARVSAIMSPRVTELSEQDLRDLSAYYAYLPRPTNVGLPRTAPPIVVNGAPMRNIAPCESCHGGFDYKTGSAWLQGESVAYLRTQLEAFAHGARHNDIDGQMRNVARGLSAQEIEQAVLYYAGSKP